VQLPLFSVFRLDLEGAGIVDVASRHATASAAGVSAEEDETSVLFGAGLAARLNWVPQRNLELYLTLGGELFFNRFDYVKAQDDELIVLLSPWPLSPTVELGLAFRP
jgi:hypothetical protein